MKEKVYHFRVKGGYFVVPAGLSVGGRAHTIKTPERETIYLPERGLELYGTLYLLPATFELEDLAQGMVNPTVELTKETLEGPTSSWLTGKLGTFGEIPKDATLFEIDKNEIDGVMRVYEEMQESLKNSDEETRRYKETEEFKRKLKDYEEKNKRHKELYGKSLPPFSYTLKIDTNPFDYLKKFDKVCEEVFVDVMGLRERKEFKYR